MKCDAVAAIRFLMSFRPDGLWVLTAIHPTQKKSTVTRTFAPSEAEDAKSWIEGQNEEHNLYFSVNPVRASLVKKAERGDIAALEYLHVDLDPREGEEFDTERERMLKALTEKLPTGMPQPSFVVDSGGGYWGFWKLSKPFVIDGQSELYEEAKRYNMQLEVLFGADACHNVDRIARLPGTINFPTKRKIAKGRTPQLAEVITSKPENIYPLAGFTPAPLVQSGNAFSASVGSGSGLVEVETGNVARLDHVDDLGDKVPELCKVVIVQGHDPDNPARFPSRSEAVFYVCCELVRSGVDDSTIYSVITDPSFMISESLRENPRRMERDATRQIERAKEKAIDPLLMEMNERHAVISDIDGKCRIISETYDDVMDRTSISLMVPTDFNVRYENRSVPLGENDDMPLGIWWRKHRHRRQYDRMTFSPGRETPGAYNLWRGFAFEAIPGDCSIYLEHLLRNVCDGNRLHYDYLIRWMAHTVQKPDQQGHVAVVLRGKKGVGKGTVATVFGALFGRHFLQVTDAKHLVGNFNIHLRDCSVLFADEAFYAGDKRHESVLKSIITENTLMVEAKGVNAGAARNYLHIIMASNDDWVVPAGGDERRFFVIDVGTGNKQDHAYFRKMHEQLNNGGYEALLHFLLNVDLSEFDPRMVPKTDALRDQKERSMSAEEDWWYDKLRNGEIFPGEGWPTTVIKSHLTFDYLQTMRAYQGHARSAPGKVGRFLSKAMPADKLQTVQFAGKLAVVIETGETREVNRPRAYQLPTLEECRKHWDENFGGPFIWNTPMSVLEPSKLNGHAF